MNGPEQGQMVVKMVVKRQRSDRHRRPPSKRAGEIVSNAGGGEVRIHRPKGQIRNSNTVGGGNDPFPPRDTK